MTMSLSCRPFLLRLSGFLAVCLAATAPAPAQELGSPMTELAARVHSQAAQIAVLSGGKPDPTASITCDGFVCHCSGVFDCALLARVCGEIDGVQGFEGDCYLPDLDPTGRDLVSHGNTLVAQVRQANLLTAPRRTARLGELAPSVRAVESDLHGLALASASASHEPPPPASITCTWDFFHCGCDNVFDCTWLSWFCGKVGGVGDNDSGCYLPDLAPGTDLLVREAQQLKRDAEKPAICR
jgi:hypothetical protein